MPPPKETPLPVAGLLALAMTVFIGIATETLPAGLLPQISQSLALSPALAGQVVTAYALGSVLAVIPLTIATSRWPRRHVLLTAVLGFLIFNGMTALATDYRFMLAVRFLAGCSAGLGWGLLGTYARRMVPVHQQGQALALAMVGTPIALSIGVPFGTWLSGLVGWRTTFGAMSVMALLLMGWIVAAVPNFPGQPRSAQRSLKHVVTTPGVGAVLAVILTWMLAHNILYTYIAPFVAPAGLGGRVDLVLLIFGFASLGGIWITSKVVDRHLRACVLLCLAGFALVMAVFAIASQAPFVILAGTAIWGLTFGGAGTLLQTAMADAAGDGADVALSMIVVVWNMAIAGGGMAGGLLLRTWGVASFPWALLALLLCGLTAAWRARSHGFPPGRRSHPAMPAGH